jgi:hypothetical protein
MAAITYHPIPTTKSRTRVSAPRRPERHLRLVPGGAAVRPTPGPATAAVYRRRRTVALVVAAVTVALLTIAAHGVVSALAGPAPAASSLPPATATAGVTGVTGVTGAAAGATVHVVQPGETLWQIASELAPGTDVRATVDRLAARNGGAAIHVGQRLVIE